MTPDEDLLRKSKEIVTLSRIILSFCRGKPVSDVIRALLGALAICAVSAEMSPHSYREILDKAYEEWVKEIHNKLSGNNK